MEHLVVTILITLRSNRITVPSVSHFDLHYSWILKKMNKKYLQVSLPNTFFGQL